MAKPQEGTGLDNCHVTLARMHHRSYSQYPHPHLRHHPLPLLSLLVASLLWPSLLRVSCATWCGGSGTTPRRKMIDIYIDIYIKMVSKTCNFSFG